MIVCFRCGFSVVFEHAAQHIRTPVSGLVKANQFDILSRSKGVTESCSSDMPDE